MPSTGGFYGIFTLSLKDLEAVLVSLSGSHGSSLRSCNKLSDVFEWFSLYSMRLYISITTWGSFGLSICGLFHLCNS